MKHEVKSRSGSERQMPELLILQFTHEASSNDHHKMFKQEKKKKLLQESRRMEAMKLRFPAAPMFSAMLILVKC